MTRPAARYQLKVTLAECRPPIWRRLVVPSTVTLADLHQILQISLGWLDYHLHLFEAGRKVYSDPQFELDLPVGDETRVRLGEVMTAKGHRLRYEYDFGDGWMHTIQLEEVLPPSGEAPVCLGGRRHRPPEDCGGPGGYEHFLQAFLDPLHEEHAEIRDWVGEEFDPEAFDRAEVNRQLAQLSTRRQGRRRRSGNV
jgi:hypothetical protein